MGHQRNARTCSTGFGKRWKIFLVRGLTRPESLSSSTVAAFNCSHNQMASPTVGVAALRV